MRTSKLETPGDRFLALTLSYSLEEMWLTPSEICDAFPPKVLMESLEGSPELRARLLVEAAGVHERIAPKKSTAAAAEDLVIALDEGVTSANAILEIIDADELVRHLDRRKIWQLMTREPYWTQDTPRAQERLLDLLSTALDQDLLSKDELISCLGVERMSQSFSRELLELCFNEALKNGLSGLNFGPEQLMDLVPVSTWLEHIPLVHIWESTVVGKIAVSAGVLEAPVKESAPSSSARKENAEEKKARDRAMAKLSSLSRLPKSAATLDTTVLLALEGMYTELVSAQTDEEREECIRDAFPNTAMMEEALLAMAETLDEQVSAQTLRERGADATSLIQLIIFEERRRANRAATSTPPPVTSSPPPSVRPDSVPPPPVSGRAGQSLPPPLPAQAAARKASIPPPPLPAQARSPRAR